MTLKKRMLLGYGVAFALMGVVVGWAVSNLFLLGKATEAILSENYRSILAAENMVDALERQDSATLLVLLGDVREGVEQFRENEAAFVEWLARAKDNVTIPGEAKLIQSIDSGYAAYRQQLLVLTDLSYSEKRHAPASFHQETIHPVFAEVREACIALRRLNEQAMYDASLSAGNVAGRAVWSTLFVALAAFLAALLFSLVLAGRIARPLRSFMDATRRISSGDYSVQVEVETRDELGILAREFNEMARQLDEYHRLNIERIISEKHKSEAILSSIEDGLVVFDTRLEVTGINPAARRMLGLEFAEDCVLRCADLFPGTSVCELIRKTVESGEQPRLPEERRMIRREKGERELYYLFSVTTIGGRERSLSGIVVLLRDISHLKELERLKSEFVMAASHELRTPLTSLAMSLDLLLERALTGLKEEDRGLLNAAHEEVHRMKVLVNDLLDLSKMETGRIDLDLESVPVSLLFDHATAVFGNQLEMKSVTISSDAAADLPHVRADANKITWVLTNLISNALRYVEVGGHIFLSAQHFGAQVHLSVRDDGPGIPKEVHSKIFHKFVQVKGRDAGGSGLGLAICKEIVRAHGGSIWLESEPGQGSTFTFTLPTAG